MMQIADLTHENLVAHYTHLTVIQEHLVLIESQNKIMIMMIMVIQKVILMIKMVVTIMIGKMVSEDQHMLIGNLQLVILLLGDF